jgi:hypothetical protein
MFDQLAGLFVHNLQLQKSPSRIFGQNSGNSVDISKVFFEIVIWEVRILPGQPASHSTRDCWATNPISARQLRLFVNWLSVSILPI